MAARNQQSPIKTMSGGHGGYYITKRPLHDVVSRNSVLDHLGVAVDLAGPDPAVDPPVHRLAFQPPVVRN